ncbi:MAG: alpha-1,2-fucosyltransferase [Acidobacteriia bacterium]|nr:alpha-1,2-fucosyltransferase [Terriglobia bacterium]
MIVVRFAGGLGNQLFQYALGRHLSLIHKRPLHFDVSGYTDVKGDPKAGIRLFGLHSFSVKGEVATPDVLECFLIYRTPGTRGRLARLANRFCPLSRKRYLQEPPSSYWQFYPPVLTSPLAEPVCLVGNWQSQKYFSHIAATLREEVSLRSPADGQNAAMLAAISASNSVAVHVRRGDRYHGEGLYGVLPVAYYHAAAGAIAGKVSRPHFYVFSDEPEWAREVLALPGPTVFVSHNGDEKNHEDLRLMAACKHHIIANSSFSWWAAWLGKKDNQLVYAPTKYQIGSNCDYSDYYPAEWNLLDAG